MDQLRLADDAVGGWLQLPGPATAELMGSVGYDFVCVDTQHGLIGDDALLPMLQALAATGTPSLVRVSHNALDVIGRALDRGAAGVVVPLVESVEEAAAAVVACHYPPRGTRSYGPTRVAWGDADVLAPGLCAVMIETAAGLAALPGILQVDGVDAVFVGPRSARPPGSPSGSTVPRPRTCIASGAWASPGSRARPRAPSSAPPPAPPCAKAADQADLCVRSLVLARLRTHDPLRPARGARRAGP
jgi:hypothetical protein